MSPDVSGMIECRPGARVWGPDDGRACHFGIRNSFGFRPVAGDRCFPDDASGGLRAEFAGYGGPHDVHGTTWLTWAELDATQWLQLYLQRREAPDIPHLSRHMGRRGGCLPR